MSDYRIECGDCLDLLRSIPSGTVDAVITDPPYGIGIIGTRAVTLGTSKSCKSNVYAPVHGDDRPFDPSVWVGFADIVCLWGANHFGDKLPSSSSWLVWDKREGGKSDDWADCELAWTNTGGPARLFNHLWRGMIRASEQDERRCHPTQKPVALMRWCLDMAGVPVGATVLDPYMGVGSTGVACLQTGRKFIGFEIDPGYCEIARRRLADVATLFMPPPPTKEEELFQ